MIYSCLLRNAGKQAYRYVAKWISPVWTTGHAPLQCLVQVERPYPEQAPSSYSYGVH